MPYLPERVAAFFTSVFLAGAFLGAAFFAEAFLAGAFFAGALRAAGFASCAMSSPKISPRSSPARTFVPAATFEASGRAFPALAMRSR